ncbi:hypothetical protein CLV51_103365 [Chitinophaga niastensis]|uniref:Uncharacterized protein n=1 Tax=Chitinophaga niastensis TaxID=536980 RepID=A0A2P8HJI9_CHINA|nr:hypothetical protein [Chitinophaga niastensis]PSL46387.1 hypothetical protein CLV51_103365 [Chitinophaga niastensis]
MAVPARIKRQGNSTYLFIRFNGWSSTNPIANLMMEKYLRDTLPAAKMPVMKRMLETGTIPMAKLEQSKLDSLNKTTGMLTPAQVLRRYFH